MRRRRRYQFAAVSAVLTTLAVALTNPSLFGQDLPSRQVVTLGLTFVLAFMFWVLAAWLTQDWLVRNWLGRHRDRGNDE